MLSFSLVRHVIGPTSFLGLYIRIFTLFVIFPFAKDVIHESHIYFIVAPLTTITALILDIIHRFFFNPQFNFSFIIATVSYLLLLDVNPKKYLLLKYAAYKIF